MLEGGEENGVAPDEFRLMLALALVPGLGPSGFHRLLEAGGSAEAVFRSPPGELEPETPRLSAETAAAILRGPDQEAADAQLRECRAAGVSLVCFRSPGYPAPLLDLPCPPPFLYLRGRWEPADARALAVVGTRYPSSYGMRVARDLCLGLAESGWTLVSGLARGIDTEAHEAALAAGGRTLAVMGTGLDRIYPPENLGLARRIETRGCLISEFPMGWPLQASNFPRRNRTLSALGRGTLVVEAGSGSGALITARFALEQGREIFAVPGSVHNPAARGVHGLIQEGAHLATCAEDILAVLRGLPQAAPARRWPETPAPEPELPLPSAPGPGPAESRRPPWLARKPASLEALCLRAAEALGREVAPQELLADLLRLEIQGKARRLPGLRFSLV